MKFCWTRAYLLSVRCPIDGVEEEWSTRDRCAQAVAQAQRKRLFEYFDYTRSNAPPPCGCHRVAVRSLSVPTVAKVAAQAIASRGRRSRAEPDWISLLEEKAQP